jgi:hypothetical protein
MIEQANARHKKIKDLDSSTRDNELIHVKMKKGMDHVHGDLDDKMRQNVLDL